MSFAALLFLTTAIPVTTLTAPQERRLGRVLACPDRLRDDAARLDNVIRFDRLYAGFVPASRAGERMAMRARLLAKKKCAPDAGRRHYTFPQE